MESLFWVICQQAVIFTLFRWDIACILWILPFFANGWVMRRPRIYTALFARSYQRMQKRFEITPKADSYSSDPKFCRELQPVLRDDLIVQSRPLVGLIMTSRTYEYKWYKVHFNCLMFAMLGPLFSAIMPFLDVARPEGGTVVGYIYDAVTFLGTLCILYSIVFFAMPGFISASKDGSNHTIFSFSSAVYEAGSKHTIAINPQLCLHPTVFSVHPKLSNDLKSYKISVLFQNAYSRGYAFLIFHSAPQFFARLAVGFCEGGHQAFPGCHKCLIRDFEVFCSLRSQSDTSQCPGPLWYKSQRPLWLRLLRFCRSA